MTNEQLNKAVQETEQRTKIEKAMKKDMQISELTYTITFRDYNYRIVLKPKGKGYFDVICRIVAESDRVNPFAAHKKVTITDYFTHGISLNTARDLVITFHDSIEAKS